MYISQQRYSGFPLPALQQKTAVKKSDIAKSAKNKNTILNHSPSEAEESKVMSSEEKTCLMRQLQYNSGKHLPADYEIVTHVASNGEEFRVAGKKMQGDASRFLVVNIDTGECICTLKRTPASQRGSVFVWMHPEDTGVKGGRPRGNEIYPASTDPWINFMGEVMVAVNTHYYFKNQTMGEASRLKSGNKYNVRVAQDRQRTELANQYITELRNKFNPGDHNELTLTRMSKAHNCYEISLLTRDIMISRGVEARLVNLSTADHYITICGSIPAHLSLDMQKWPEDTYICDSYANIRCAAREYPDRFREKMDKWAAIGKLLYFYPEQEWIIPNDSRLMNSVIYGLKEFG